MFWISPLCILSRSSTILTLSFNKQSCLVRDAHPIWHHNLTRASKAHAMSHGTVMGHGRSSEFIVQPSTGAGKTCRGLHRLCLGGGKKYPLKSGVTPPPSMYVCRWADGGVRRVGDRLACPTCKINSTYLRSMRAVHAGHLSSKSTCGLLRALQDGLEGIVPLSFHVIKSESSPANQGPRLLVQDTSPGGIHWIKSNQKIASGNVTYPAGDWTRGGGGTTTASNSRYHDDVLGLTMASYGIMRIRHQK